MAEWAGGISLGSLVQSSLKEVGYVTGLRGWTTEESKYCWRPFIKACRCVRKIWRVKEPTRENTRLIRDKHSPASFFFPVVWYTSSGSQINWYLARHICMHTTLKRVLENPGHKTIGMHNAFCMLRCSIVCRNVSSKFRLNSKIHSDSVFDVTSFNPFSI